MDSVTQIVLGGAVAAAVGGRVFGRKTLLVGAALGTLPDLDSFIPYASAIDEVTYHRGFSHSLFVLAALSVVLWWVMCRVSPNARQHSVRLWWMIALTLLTHPLLDAFTTYGTQLFWPLEPTPAALSSIFIIDPLYTLPLLFACLFYAWKPSQSGLFVGLGLSSAYLVWTLVAQSLILERVQTHWQDKGVAPRQTLVTPLPFTTAYWRVLAIFEDHYEEAALSVLGKGAITWQREPLGNQWATQVSATDRQRLRWFTDDRMALVQQEEDLIAVDLRMGGNGFWPFQYRMAQRDGDQWTPMVSERVDVTRPGMDALLEWYRSAH